jgi:dipeptidyl aminopeptidase/acylaminoacyl peptidase
MARFALPLIAALVLAGVAGVSHGAPLTIADAFKPSLVQSMRLSPDGQRVLVFGRNKETTGAVVMDLAEMKPTLLRSSLGGTPWDARWLSKDLVAVAMGDETHVFDTSGKLVRRVSGFFKAALQPDGNGHERVLVQAERSYFDRVDVRTGEATHLPFAWPNDRQGGLLTDRDGVPRVLVTLSDDRAMLTYWYRAAAEVPWQPIESQLRIDLRWRPAALAEDGRSLIVFSSEGRDTAAVFRYSLEEHALKEMMAGHPSEDISSVMDRVGQVADELEDTAAEGSTNEFVRVVTLGMKTTTYWFDPKWDSLQRSVDAALPGKINVLSGNPRAGRVLVTSYADVDPGTWYLLDVATSSLKQIESAKPEIDRNAMAPMQVVRYKSLDGLEIPAYLTLPPGGGRNLPAVVLVHGGPIVRDRWQWQPEVQLLASRGYAVLQPQFRGSAGFGRRFELAGHREWGRSMQDDITAGAEWLAAQGIADARRICIYGASYGGYAALWAAVKTPDLFRCVASFAGVSDLALMFTAKSDTNSDPYGQLAERRLIGDPATDAKLFDEVSPLKGAARFRVPVLLAHGDLDVRVPIVHSEKMMEALKANGKQFEWILLRGEKHGISRDAARERFYGALFDFLARNTAAPPRSAEPATR